MKRPLFWAVTAFALGEVEGLCQDRTVRIGIAAAMLICVALWSRRYFSGQYLKYCFIYALCAVAGFLNVTLRAPVCIGGDISSPICIEGYVCDLLPREEGFDAVIRIYDSNYEIKLLIYKAPADVSIGDYVSLEGKAAGFSRASNPGGFDMERYYQARGIDGILTGISYQQSPVWEKLAPSVRDVSLLEQIRSGVYHYKNVLLDFRNILKDIFYSLDAETAGIYTGLLLGDRSGIDDSLMKLYQSAGISHILAISGTHISLLGLGLFWVLRKAGVGFPWASVWSVLFLVCYGGMTGGGFSTMRAIIMLMYVFLGRCLGRGADCLTGAAVALLVMLAGEPRRLLDGGLLLSFSAILGVALGQYCLRRLCSIESVRMMQKKHRLLYRCLSLVVRAISIQMILAPVLAYLYYVLPVYSVFCNLIVLPTVPVLLVSGLAGLFLGGFCHCPVFGHMALSVGGGVLELYEQLCRLVLKLPFHSIYVGKPAWTTLILYYVFLLLLVILTLPEVLHRLRLLVYRCTHRWYQKSAWIQRMAVVYVCLFLSGGMLLYQIHRYSLCEQIVFLDVGQGDGILIRTAEGSSFVIDGGSGSREGLGEYVLVPALQALGMAQVDYWFVSHTDTDHISGLRDILRMGELSGVHIDNIVFSAYAVADDNMEELCRLAAMQEINICYMRGGEYVSDERSFQITCMHPDSGFATEDINQASLALEYCSADYAMLFTGDMDTAALEYMLRARDNRSRTEHYDVIKAAHHGSKYSCLPSLYDITDTVVISCGVGNSYGHPHIELLQTLEEAGVNIRRTDEEGAVIFRARGRQ